MVDGYCRARLSPKKKHRTRMADVSVHLSPDASYYQDPGILLAKSIRQALNPNTASSPVRTLEHRIGEVHNLADRWEHLRSCAAILAKKYRMHHTFLNTVYNTGSWRPLTEKEVRAVFRIVGELEVRDGTHNLNWAEENDHPRADRQPERALDEARGVARSWDTEEDYEGRDGLRGDDLRPARPETEDVDL